MPLVLRMRLEPCTKVLLVEANSVQVDRVLGTSIQEVASSNGMAVVISPYQEQEMKVFLHSSARAFKDDEELQNYQITCSTWINDSYPI